MPISYKLSVYMYLCYVAVGEPPMVMSNAVIFAVKHAIESARFDHGSSEYFTLCKCFLIHCQ